MPRPSSSLQSRGVSDARAYIAIPSSELTRDINRDIILERIRSLQPISRVDLARASGLQPSTVSSIVAQLLEEKWIEEGASVRTARGRRPTMLCLNRSSAILVADVRPLHAIVAVVDLNGQILARQTVPLGSDARQGTGAIAAAMRTLRQSLPEKTFEGVGLSMPGRVNPESSRLILAPNLRWSNFDIRRALARLLDLPVELENAANACLLSEIWFGHMDGVRNAVLLTLSEGLGGAILAEGRLITGHAGLAGEFGHVPLDLSGPRCGCGQKGCWEMYASSSAALRYLCEITGSKKKLNISELIALALDGNPAAVKAIRKQATAIGAGLRIVTAAVSPEIIVFAGDITACWDTARAAIQEQCHARMLAGKPPRLVSIGDGETARLRGAAALVLQRHSGYYRANRYRNLASKQSAQGNSGQL